MTVNGTWQCVFLDLPSYTIYSATGSFFIPLAVMFFVYYKIYQAFAEHRARQLYRQKVLLDDYKLINLNIIQAPVFKYSFTSRLKRIMASTEYAHV